jgi:2-methylcitrate dehydratase PrpD
MSLAQEFASLIHDWPAEGEALSQRCRQLLIDGVACAVGGSDYPASTIAGAVAAEQRAAGIATVIAQDFATSEVNAARVNGIAMHVLDFEPMWRPANHAVSCVVPAALAAAERMEWAGAPPMGARLLVAVAKGVEVAGRLRRSSGQYNVDDLRFHPPGVVGPLAAAVAAAWVLGLDRKQTGAALGISTSRACGIIVNVGSMTKALHCGDAAAHGLEAALLAQRGFSANADTFAGIQGYAAIYFGDSFDPAPLLAGLEPPYALDPGPAWKLFPAQYATHYAITAALDCRSEITNPADIESVEATVPVMPYIDRPKPDSGLAGKFSLQYGIATALLDGHVDVDTYSDARRFSVDVEDMLGRIRLKFDPSIPRQVDKMQVAIEVRMKGGETFHRRCDAPIGSWKRPASQADLDAKARGLLEPAIGADAASRLFDIVRGKPEDFSVRDLMACVAGRHTETVPAA